MKEYMCGMNMHYRISKIEGLWCVVYRVNGYAPWHTSDLTPEGELTAAAAQRKLDDRAELRKFHVL